MEGVWRLEPMTHSASAEEPGGTRFDDAHDVAEARRGDRAAFGRLYGRHARWVQALLLARVPVDEAADLLHDVFLVAIDRLGSLRDDAAFPGFLATIARRRNASSTMLRSLV